MSVSAAPATRVAVVTGGASGIGEACAQALAADGWRVVIADLDTTRGTAVAERLGARFRRLDVGDEDDILAVAVAVETHDGPVEALVNSAGIIQRPQRPHELSTETWDRVQRIDLRGTWLACRAFATAMLARRRGSIVNISSITGTRSVPLHAYAPAKAAVVSLTQCLAAEWGPAGIRVNSVAPGYTLTPALQDAIDRGERDVAILERNAALQCMVLPADVADAVSFLCSPRARVITGVDLPVDAGWLAASGWNTYGGLRAPA